MALDVDALVGELTTAASGAIQQDVSTLGGFSRQQLEDIARQAGILAAGIVDGSITSDLYGYFLGQIKEMVQSFANTLAGLAAVAAEKVWNAMVGVLWGAIGQVAGVVLPAV